MQNPFEFLDSRLSNIESILSDLKVSDTANKNEPQKTPLFNKIPAQSVYSGPGKLMSKPTFYQHVKDGKITLYKLGGRSYVDAAEFNSIFHKVQIAK